MQEQVKYTVVSALRSSLGSVRRCLSAVPVEIVIFAVIFYLDEAAEIVAEKLVIPIEIAVEAVRS